ncbi:MAG: hypothetical protein AB1635_05230 [Acidobacteriota bacterium]
MRLAARPWAIGASAPATVAAGMQAPATPAAHQPQAVRATRVAQNPLITVTTAASLGGNVNGCRGRPTRSTAVRWAPTRFATARTPAASATWASWSGATACTSSSRPSAMRPSASMASTIDLAGDWTTWRASAPVEVLRPEASYECVDPPVAASAAGDVAVPARQLRDPYVFEDDGRLWLHYTSCGEQGIAAAELVVP